MHLTDSKLEFAYTSDRPTRFKPVIEFSENQVARVRSAIATALGDRDVELLDMSFDGSDLIGAINRNGDRQQFRLETRLKFGGNDLNEFAESKGTQVSDRTILEQIRNDLEARIGRVDRVYGVSVTDKDIFYGKAQKKLNATRSEIFSFKIDPEAGRITYKMDNADEMLKYGETDEAWAETYEFAATGKGSRAGKKLNCRPGNSQCGGKCQDGNRACPSQMSEAERKAYKAAARKARNGESKAPADVVKTAVNQWKKYVADNTISDRQADLSISIAKAIEQAIPFLKNNEQFRSVIDSSGDIQAIGLINPSSGTQSLYVNRIASAPWNVTSDRTKRTRGAATQIIKEAIRQSIDAGFEGRLTTDPIGRSKSFYQRLGFVQRTAGVGLLELSPEKAAELLNQNP